MCKDFAIGTHENRPKGCPAFRPEAIPHVDAPPGGRYSTDSSELELGDPAVNFACSQCGKMLSVRDDLAGRKARCPACQNVETIPFASAAAPDAVTAAKPRSLPPDSIASSPIVAPKPTNQRCPECAEPLPVDAGWCNECGWDANATSVRTTRGTSRNLAPASGKNGRCYVFLTRDPLQLEAAIREKVMVYIESEMMDLEMSDEDPPEQLGPNDILVTGKITHHDFGSRFIRYWLTFIAIFGPGSCKLHADLEIEDGAGNIRHVPVKIRQCMGLFGGDSDGMMQLNIKHASQKAATAMAQHKTGYTFLNHHIYQYALASLILGITSFIPFVGVATGLCGLFLGLPALVVINKRNLPKRKGMAIAGLILSTLGILGNIAFFVLAMK